MDSSGSQEPDCWRNSHRSCTLCLSCNMDAAEAASSLCLWPTMKFAAKYEILEAVTRGSVETFAARKIATDEVVLVHIFECQDQQPHQPTVQWILESFRAVAPDPCGLVVETGRYEDTSYGYLVVKRPEKSALQAWVQSYEARRQAADGLIAPSSGAPAIPSPERTSPETGSLPAGDEPTRVFRTNQPIDHPEGITEEFEALRSELKPRSTADQSTGALHVDGADAGTISADFRAIDFEGKAAVQPRMLGDFTQQFFPAFEDEHKSTPALSGNPLREERRDPDRLTDRTSATGSKELQHPPASSNTETPSAVFRRTVLSSTSSLEPIVPDSSSRSSGAPQPKPTIATASGQTGPPSTGEFTKFFRGPFDGERPADTPDLSPPVVREEKDTGDFTRLFGSAKGDSSSGLTPLPGGKSNVAAASDSGSFTKLFESTGVPRKTSSAYDSVVRSTDWVEAGNRGPAAAKGPPSSASDSGTVRALADTPAPTTDSRNKEASISSDLPFSSRPELEGATRVFSPANREPLSGTSALPAGPSEYTRIISGGLKKPSSPQELRPVSESSASASAVLPNIAPAIPAAGPPQIPPVVSHSQAPAPPQIPAVPAAHVPPVATSAPKVTGTPWAMILILNGLFVLAVLLVLYFVFRH